jgi:hypothetical protein
MNNTIEQLRAHGDRKVSVATPAGSVTGYVNQPLLGDKTVFALIGDILKTPANEATVVAIDDITAVHPA